MVKVTFEIHKHYDFILSRFARFCAIYIILGLWREDVQVLRSLLHISSLINGFVRAQFVHFAKFIAATCMCNINRLYSIHMPLVCEKKSAF